MDYTLTMGGLWLALVQRKAGRETVAAAAATHEFDASRARRADYGAVVPPPPILTPA